MPDASEKRGWFASLPNDSTTKTLIVAVALCLICSVAVSMTAVALKPQQERNSTLAREWQILRVADLLEEGVDQSVLFEQVQPRMVDMDSGEFTESFDARSFDLLAAARDPNIAEPLNPDADVAGIGVRMRYMPVYLVEQDGELATVVLPVWTKGLYSTLRGFLALRGDGNTIQGLTFYEDGETPGLGGEINNPRWQAQWQDKEVYGDDGDILIKVTKNAADPDHDIDALSGATLTSRGVDNMMKFWMGEAGYGPFLANLRSGGSIL
jgi:Na+-transporting NADH:ubiquinone oxidoreductase subunit C